MATIKQEIAALERRLKAMKPKAAPKKRTRKNPEIHIDVNSHNAGKSPRAKTNPSGRPIALKIRANNDSNGNPRRGWFVWNSGGGLQGFVDEAYNGDSYVRELFPNVVELGVIDIAPAQYTAAKKLKRLG